MNAQELFSRSVELRDAICDCKSIGELHPLDFYDLRENLRLSLRAMDAFHRAKYGEGVAQ